MPPPLLKPVSSAPPLGTDLEVTSLACTSAGLRIEVTSPSGGALALFQPVLGFRVLDEGDLGEFWSQVTLRNGWLFEVLEGGWLALEETRPAFFRGRSTGVREFLVAGIDACVSVICHGEPEVQG